AGERRAGFVHRVALVVDGGHLARGLVEQLRLRAVARAEPVRRALNVREHPRALEARRDALLAQRPALRIDAVGPRLLHVWRRSKILAGRAIRHVVEAVALGWW